MKAKRRGHILGMSSLSGNSRIVLSTYSSKCSINFVCVFSPRFVALHALPHAVIYTSTRCAVHGFMQSLNQDLRSEGYGKEIHTTCVLPYFVSTRKDLMDLLDLRFPAMTVEMVANEAIDSMLRNERNVTIPRTFKFLIPFMKSLPGKTQMQIRDKVLREGETKRF